MFMIISTSNRLSCSDCMDGMEGVTESRVSAVEAVQKDMAENRGGGTSASFLKRRAADGLGCPYKNTRVLVQTKVLVQTCLYFADKIAQSCPDVDGVVGADSVNVLQQLFDPCLSRDKGYFSVGAALHVLVSECIYSSFSPVIYCGFFKKM